VTADKRGIKTERRAMKKPSALHRSLFETHAFSAMINAPVGEIALPRDGETHVTTVVLE